MNPWLLFPVSVGVLYSGGMLLKLVFREIENYQRLNHRAAEPRNNGAKRSRERSA